MTDRQRGRACALNLIVDVFTEAAWQRGLASARRDAAIVIKHKDVPETVKALVEPFWKCLEGKPLPGAPFDSVPLENPSSDIDTAVSILVGVFGGFIRGAGPGNWTWREIADDLVKRVEYEQRNRSQAFKQATADLVGPFHSVLSYSGAM